MWFLVQPAQKVKKEAGRLVISARSQPFYEAARVKGIPVVIVSPFYSSFQAAKDVAEICVLIQRRDQLSHETTLQPPEHRGIRFKPHTWLSVEWFTPDAVRRAIGCRSQYRRKVFVANLFYPWDENAFSNVQLERLQIPKPHFVSNQMMGPFPNRNHKFARWRVRFRKIHINNELIV
jgi:hypothetical protein